jgi:hypothetical protein
VEVLSGERVYVYSACYLRAQRVEYRIVVAALCGVMVVIGMIRWNEAPCELLVVLIDILACHSFVLLAAPCRVAFCK